MPLIASILRIVPGVVFVLLAAFPSPGEESTVHRRVAGAVLEVVVPRPAERPDVVWERPLPVDQLPFVERSDSMISIGSAFAIAPDIWVSAAHVLPMGLRGQGFRAFLRGSAGDTFPITEFLAYSQRRDHAVFRIRGPLVARPLEVRTGNVPVQTSVWAVGNALGEGVIQRGGVFTSTTPEELDGAWRFMRFSAAASPGNSGGPLVDDQGRVLGIVLRKSPNENLNHALPLDQVPLGHLPDSAHVFQRIRSYLDLLPDHDTLVRNETALALPMSYEQLDAAILTVESAWHADLIPSLRRRHADRLFPRRSSGFMTFGATRHPVPNLPMASADGILQPTFHVEQAVPVGADGTLLPGTSGPYSSYVLSKPDTVPLAQFNEAVSLMRFILRGEPMLREMAGQSIRCLSLGAPDHTAEHLDAHGRRWRIASWEIPWLFGTEKMLIWTPIPAGAVAFQRYSSSRRSSKAHIAEFLKNLDYTIFPYHGTLEAWREFLELDLDVPPWIRSMHINVTDDLPSIRSPGFDWAPPRSTRTTSRPTLSLRPGWEIQGDSVRMAIRGIEFQPSQTMNTGFFVERLLAPASDDVRAFRDEWSRMLAGEPPYDGYPVPTEEWLQALSFVPTDNDTRKGWIVMTRLPASLGVRNVNRIHRGHLRSMEIHNGSQRAR